MFTESRLPKPSRVFSANAKKGCFTESRLTKVSSVQRLQKVVLQSQMYRNSAALDSSTDFLPLLKATGK